MLKSYFDKIAIQNKLYAMHFLVTGAALFLVFIMLVSYQYLSFKNDLLNELNSQLAVIDGNVGAAVAFEDKYAALEALQSFSLNSSVDQAYIVLNNNTVFAEYRSQKLKSLPQRTLSNFAEIAKRSTIHLTRQVMVNQQQVATLYLDANLNQMNSRVKVFCFALIAAILMAMLLARQISRILNKHITDPIAYLEHLVSSITKNQNYTKRSALESNDEIGALSAGINNMLENIESRDSKLVDELEHRKIVEKKLDHLAYFDNQTTLPNRHAFNEHIETLMRECVDEHGFYLLMLDLDNFKMVNDTLGHHGGDVLLKECGERLRSILSKMDALFRIGGDEFAITLRGIRAVEDVEKICHRIIRTISQTFLIDDHEIVVGVSLGAIQYLQGNYNQSSLIKNADVAMYWAKSDGKNTCKFYSKEIEEARFQQQKLISNLQVALKNKELELYYQPIISIDSGLIIGFEALLRWQHPELGMISPDVFIPIAENTGLIIPIGDWVINTSIAQIKTWQGKYSPHLFVNINLSGRQFQDVSMVSKIHSVIHYHQIRNPATIKFELTESILMEDVPKTVQILTALREIGVGVAVDDFGTGHSSMNYLKQFPVTTLKIDKSFVRGLPDDHVDVAIVESILALARSLKLIVVAEGVETEEQLEFLRKHRCKKAQGYLISRPVPAMEIEKLMDQFHSVLRGLSQ